MNISNIISDDLKGKKGIFTIKKFDKDKYHYKSEKEFDMDPGEINDMVTLQLKWPVKNFKSSEF